MFALTRPGAFFKTKALGSRVAKALTKRGSFSCSTPYLSLVSGPTYDREVLARGSPIITFTSISLEEAKFAHSTLHIRVNFNLLLAPYDVDFSLKFRE